MNGNIYSERDLIAAATRMEGACPSLNHKDEYWFSPENPRNHWGNISVVKGTYEDGAVECVLKVPKNAVCPICNGEKMTELIDKKRIVNVSLEGGCTAGNPRTGECVGFEFNQKTFSLLTTDVLPGFPMARIFPMESYLPFSQSSRKRKIRVIGLKNEKKEKLLNVCGTCNWIGQEDSNAPLTVCPQCGKQAFNVPVIPKESIVREPCSPEKKQCVDDLIAKGHDESSAWAICTAKMGESKVSEAPTSLAGDQACPQGQIWSGTAGKCVAIGTEPDGEQAGNMNNASPGYGQRTPERNPEGSDVAIGKDAGPDTTATPSIQGESIPQLKVAKLKAERAMQNLILEKEELLAKLTEAYAKDNRQQGEVATLKTQIERLEKQVSIANNEKVTDSTEQRSLTRRLQYMTKSRDGYKTELEKTKVTLEETNEKYKDTLKKNLKLEQIVTETNEEYLKVAKERDTKEEALKKTKNLAGKIRVIGLESLKK